MYYIVNLIYIFLLFNRKLSSEEADSEFMSSDLDEDNYITWKEYVSDSYGSSINSISDFEEDDVIINFVYFIYF